MQYKKELGTYVGTYVDLSLNSSFNIVVTGGISMNYNTNRVLKLFATSKDQQFNPEKFIELVKNKILPPLPKNRKSWPTKLLPQIGQEIGFLPAINRCKVVSFFVTKGGALKTSLALNFARTCALHNIKTLVIGLDMQADITTSLGYDWGFDESLNSSFEQLDAVQGLADHFFNKIPIKELIIESNLPSLHFIPETPEIIALNQALNLQNKREFWLKNKILDSLKAEYDLIVFDAPPNWNLMITNALIASDLLVSPLECKVNNYRNFKMFHRFINEFQSEMDLKFQHVYIPTRLNTQRRLSRDIFTWYCKNIKNCLPQPVKESNVAEEAIALNISTNEYSPGHDISFRMNQICQFLIESLIAQEQPYKTASFQPTEMQL